MEVIRSIWLFIQDQVLGMKWLNTVIENGLSAAGLDISTRWGGSAVFYDECGLQCARRFYLWLTRCSPLEREGTT